MFLKPVVNFAVFSTIIRAFFLLASLKKCYENTKGVWFQSPKLKFTFSKIASKVHMKEALLFDWVL